MRFTFRHTVDRHGLSVIAMTIHSCPCEEDQSPTRQSTGCKVRVRINQFTSRQTVSRHRLSALAMTTLEERDNGEYPTSPSTHVIAGSDNQETTQPSILSNLPFLSSRRRNEKSSECLTTPLHIRQILTRGIFGCITWWIGGAWIGS